MAGRKLGALSHLREQILGRLWRSWIDLSKSKLKLGHLFGIFFSVRSILKSMLNFLRCCLWKQIIYRARFCGPWTWTTSAAIIATKVDILSWTPSKPNFYNRTTMKIFTRLVGRLVFITLFIITIITIVSYCLFIFTGLFRNFLTLLKEISL